MISRYSSDDAAGKLNLNIFSVFPQVQDWISCLFSEKKNSKSCNFKHFLFLTPSASELLRAYGRLGSCEVAC